MTDFLKNLAALVVLAVALAIGMATYATLAKVTREVDSLQHLRQKIERGLDRFPFRPFRAGEGPQCTCPVPCPCSPSCPCK